MALPAVADANADSVSNATFDAVFCSLGRIRENGQERTEIEEDGVLKAVLINGVRSPPSLRSSFHAFMLSFFSSSQHPTWSLCRAPYG